jgi:Na+/H+ antiporter NhaD/arsenite permease-like protein
MHYSIASDISGWTALPFALLLLCIAILPLAAPRFWDSNRNKGLVVLALGFPVAAYLPLAFGAAGVHRLIDCASEYVSFLALLGSLYVITGGIHVSGSLSGTPLLNTALLGIGALLANVFGTTGASVLLVRPLLRANEPRERKAHIIVFFIFVVSNCGGLLTPLGDPPLFLGFLEGVPFTWTLRLWLPWLIVNGALLAIFNVWDQIVFAREERERPGSQLEEVMEHAPLRIGGKRNFGFLLGIVAVIAASGSGLGTGGERWPFGIQESAMLAIAATAWWVTHHEHRRANRFDFAPIIEVAVLFAGIFVTMAPALLLLNARAPELGLREPWQFFWAAGLLSSFLDNAPTYLTFAATACGIAGVPLEGRYLTDFLALGPESARVLSAIATGSVFMGANSYIGNGPNFVVKAIAEQNGVSMPSFFGYMAYSGAVLLPLFTVVTFVAFA